MYFFRSDCSGGEEGGSPGQKRLRKFHKLRGSFKLKSGKAVIVNMELTCWIVKVTKVISSKRMILSPIRKVDETPYGESGQNLIYSDQLVNFCL